MFKNMVEPEAAFGACALHAGYVRLQARKRTHTHTHTPDTRIRFCFSSAKMVSRTRLNVTFYVHCLSCYT
jgi:hypothetical protein